jgi:hypothetical protein
MLAVLRFVFISDWKMQKKFKNRLWKSRACVSLSSDIIYTYNRNASKYLRTKLQSNVGSCSKMIIIQSNEFQSSILTAQFYNEAKE